MQNLTKEELQQAYLLFAKDFHVFLGCTKEERRKIVEQFQLKTPTDFVKSMTEEELSKAVLQHGSLENAAAYHGVSYSFMKGVIREKIGFESPEHLALKSKDKVILSTFYDEIKRVGSVDLMSRLWNTTPSTIRSYAKAHSIELSKLIKYDTSGFENAKGRRGELCYADIRGKHILRDLNVEVGSQAEWDYDDDQLGRVDVKASKVFEHKAKNRRSCKQYWKFSVSSLECDFVAFMAMDVEFKVNHHLLVIPAEWVPEKQNTLSINELVYKNTTAHPISGLPTLTQEQFDKWVIKGSITELLPYDKLRRKRG